MILLALLCAAALDASIEGKSAISEPVVATAPSNVASSWNQYSDFKTLPAISSGAVQVHMPDAFGRSQSVRVDVFRRLDGRWDWQETYLASADFSLPVTDERRAVLLRQRAQSFYAWGEVAAKVSTTVLPAVFKNVAFKTSRQAPSHAAGQALFVASEPQPRDVPSDGIVRFVPLRDSIACTIGLSGNEQCALIAPNATEAHFLQDFANEPRVVGLARGAEITLLVPGRTPATPRPIEASLSRAGNWLAVTLPEGVTWDIAVADITTPDEATERVRGIDLSRPPGFTRVVSRSDHGVSIRPWVGEPRRPLYDGTALAVLFNLDDAKIAVASATLNHDGVFSFPELGAGTYRLQVYSNVAASLAQTAVVTPLVPLDIVMSEGAQVTGRVSRAVAGNPADPLTVQLVFQGDVSAGSDLTDFVRLTHPSEDGSFRVPAPQRGKYTVSASWGAARSREAIVEIKSVDDTVDVGTLVLEGGPTLRGEIDSCAAGEVVAVPVPDRARSATLSIPPVRYARVRDDRTFTVEGLAAGQWSVAIKCGNERITIEPAIVTIRDTGDTVVAFHRAP